MSIKTLIIKFSIIFNLGFANNDIYHAFFLFFLIADFCCLNPTVVAEIINPNAKLEIPIGIPTNKAKAEIKWNPVIAEKNMHQLNVIWNHTNVPSF